MLRKAAVVRKLEMYGTYLGSRLIAISTCQENPRAYSKKYGKILYIIYLHNMETLE